MKHMQETHDILNKALQKFEPSLMVLSFSGGYDSMVSSHIAAQWSKRYAHSTNVITLSVDTLISADGWRDFIQNTARQLDLPRLEIRHTDRINEWKDKVIEKGFPYTRSQHKINFYYLKQVAFRQVVADYKKYRTDRILFVDGVRRAESSARQNGPETYRQGSGAHVNPILYWSDEQVEQYRIDNEMPDNPFYDTVGNSGDCLCNWHTNFDLGMLDNNEQAGKVIKPLDRICRHKFGYGYGERPSKGTFTPDTSDDELPGLDDTPNLCDGCQKPGVSNDERASIMLQRLNWGE